MYGNLIDWDSVAWLVFLMNWGKLEDIMDFFAIWTYARQTIFFLNNFFIYWISPKIQPSTLKISPIMIFQDFLWRSSYPENKKKKWKMHNTQKKMLHIRNRVIVNFRDWVISFLYIKYLLLHKDVRLHFVFIDFFPENNL